MSLSINDQIITLFKTDLFVVLVLTNRSNDLDLVLDQASNELNILIVFQYFNLEYRLLRT